MLPDTPDVEAVLFGEDGVAGEVAGPPLADFGTLDSFQPPWELLDGLDLSDVNENCARSDLYTRAGCCPRPFERMQFLRGSENLFYDLGYGVAEVYRLRDMVHDYYVREMELWAKTDVDALSFMDDWGAQTALLISPNQWREFYKPLYRDYCRIAHSHGKAIFFHSDGFIEPIYPDLVVETHGNMPGDMLNMGFLLLNPARLMLDKYVGYFENVHDKTFVENFIRMEKWIFDSPDVPGDTFRQFASDFYKKNLLIQNKLEIGGRHVDLKNITMPLLNFYGMYDHLVPPEACGMLTKCVGSTDTEDITLDTGHIGIYVSSKCQREFAPKIVRWLRERDGEAKFPAAYTVDTAATAQPVMDALAVAAGKADEKDKAGPRPRAKRVARASGRKQSAAKRQTVKPSLTQIIQDTI